MTQESVVEDDKLTHEEKLEALVFKFITLYDRISEDRLVGAKLSADTKKLVTQFVDQVNRFEKLIPAVCDALASAIKRVIANAANEVSQEINHAAFRATENIAEKLKSAASDTEQTLLRANAEAKHHFLKTILISVGSAIASSLLIVWLLMPKPTLPLFPSQIEAMHYGDALVSVFPKLSKSEQTHLAWLINEHTELRKN